jgi:hypothetical protein
VHRYNPCTEELLRGHHYPDLLLPIMTPAINIDDFRELDDRCNSLFQSSQWPQLQNQYLYKHLRELDPTLGVQLSTLHMLSQAVTGGDITRMASNIIKLNNLKHVVSRSNAMHHVASNPNEDLIQVMSLSTDDFIVDPKRMAQRFMNFCFGNTVADKVKRGIALKYEQSYLDLKSGSHVTHTSGNTDMLKESLRSDALFGRVLGNIENVVEQALAESRG